MPGAEAFKVGCEHCGVHLEFPGELAGTRIPCPACGAETLLAVPAGTGGTPASEAPEEDSQLTLGLLLSRFQGKVPRSPVSMFYVFGLLLVAIVMLLLPVLYVGLIGLAGYLVYWWAVHFTFLLHGHLGGIYISFLRVLLYFGPIFGGIVVVLFMIKPLFAPEPPAAQPLALNPGAEPLLSSFISEICRLIGAPEPARIDLSCDLNAGASFRRDPGGILSGGLILTVGLPLAAGLSITQLAEVVAHEFGHFTQPMAMRLYFIIGSVNYWFARVVYRRDNWDVALEEIAEESEEGWLSIILAFTRLAVWGSRQVLKVLMLTGHAAGCFMSRHMEYNADRYAIELVGSSAFEETTKRLHVLEHAMKPAFHTMRVSWNMNSVLPENFPAHLLTNDVALSPAKRAEIEDRVGLGTTNLLDTHPSSGDRIREARRAQRPGVFALDLPAAALFANFDAVAKQVSFLYYTEELGVPPARIRTRRV